MTVLLPSLPTIKEIEARLKLVFPEGTENRNYVTREMAARTVYVMLYAGAVEGADRWIRPSQVYLMTHEQAATSVAEERIDWYPRSLKPGYRPAGERWYADTTREPVRDETLRSGFVPCRAVVQKAGVPTTSSKPTFALDSEFAHLFDPALLGEALDAAISAWRGTHLSKAALSRQRLVRHGATEAGHGSVSVAFPNGETRRLAPGPSSVIAKAVIEVFAPLFLKQPAVLWLSESGNHVVARDEALANQLGLTIDASKALPDIILVDIGEAHSGADMLVVFVEVVASDGPVNRERKQVLTTLALEAGFDDGHLAFLTAYLDRSSTQFKKTVPELAWGSYAWFASEPEHIIQMRDGKSLKLSQLAMSRDKD